MKLDSLKVNSLTLFLLISSVCCTLGDQIIIFDSKTIMISVKVLYILLLGEGKTKYDNSLKYIENEEVRGGGFGCGIGEKVLLLSLLYFINRLSVSSGAFAAHTHTFMCIIENDPFYVPT